MTDALGSPYEIAKETIRVARLQWEAMRRALEQSMELPGGMAWEEEMTGVVPPIEQEAPRMSMEDLATWEQKRRTELIQQMRLNWDESRRHMGRRSWHTGQRGGFG